MEKIFIVAAKRTPVGSFGGSLKNMDAGHLGAVAIQGALSAASLAPEAVDEVIVGNVIGAGQGMGIGRQASLFAGIPETTPAYSINMVCGSGMKSVMEGVSHILSGDAQVVVAAGVEVMSQIPYALSGNIRDGHKMGDMTLVDLLIRDGLTDIFNQYHMGCTAENIAGEYDISREAQDQFSLSSQQKAVAAIKAGKFVDEIVPVEVKIKRDSVMFDTDEYPKAETSIERLAGLRPAFMKDGTVTAGNASGLNDGASAVIVASESAVKAFGLTPLVEIVSYAQAGVDPKVMGLGPVPAVAKALKRAGKTLDEMDLLELNEAFAAQALGVVKGLSREHAVSEEAILQKANVNGGAIALGHPLGASGNRILVTLIHELKRRGDQYGVASLCIGGGMGTAVIVKAVG
ncbi:acetyl-CoA C-acetyltransferase [Vibrio spartinae]|uniref:Acetyl-CoA acetyltransferase n=1 Tax=Vibrio spartinae TaxID=1918945 RepID=A0ABX6R4Z4_9VIBR|nr:acetyl-CoA C-acetyltransferase [Vibrio spartinae]QMV16492.1 Acetyl-CoA acetyltransferase [Vibrio spartinae]